MNKTEIHIPYETIFRVLGTALVVYLIVELSTLIMTLFLAIMLAVTLHPFLKKMIARGWPNWLALATVATGIALGLALLIGLVLPPLMEQCAAMLNNMPTIQKTVYKHIPLLKDVVLPDPMHLATPLLSAGQIALGGVVQFFLMLVFTVYLLSDGPQTVKWILAFFSEERKRKLQITAYETSQVISAYVSGQVITSVICGLYSFIVLTILKVPNAVMLATMAAVFDVLPVLGFFLAAVPAIMMAMTVSSVTALIVLGFYVGYHAVENYLLVPKIYGNRLRLSDLVVLVSLLAAGTFGGIIGAIAVLPLVASYPIIERIWLVDILGRSVVKKHAAEAAASAPTPTVSPTVDSLQALEMTIPTPR